MISSEMTGIVGPALVASLMIALTHAPLGIEVLKRGIIFIDLAVAQIAGLGWWPQQLSARSIRMGDTRDSAGLCDSGGIIFSPGRKIYSGTAGSHYRR